MTIKITHEPDIHITAGDLARYRHDYHIFMGHYAGPPIALEEYIRGRQAADQRANANDLKSCTAFGGR